MCDTNATSNNYNYNYNNNNKESTCNDKSIIPMTQIIFPIPTSLISADGKLMGSSNHSPNSPLPLVSQNPYEGMIKVDVDARSLWRGECYENPLTNVTVDAHASSATLNPAYLVPLV